MEFCPLQKRARHSPCRLKATVPCRILYGIETYLARKRQETSSDLPPIGSLERSLETVEAMLRGGDRGKGVDGLMAEEIELRIAEIEAREKASPYWAPEECGYTVEMIEDEGEEPYRHIHVPECTYIPNTCIATEGYGEGLGEAWEFIAHAHRDVRWLLSRLREAMAATKVARGDVFEEFLSRRGIVNVCRDCDGSGRKVYGSTSTWRGGIGGCAMTSDVCDRCWGSGDEQRPGMDLRHVVAMERVIAILRV